MTYDDWKLAHPPEYDDAPDAEEDDDACTCATSGVYLCLRCERIAESQDIGF